MTAAIVLFRTPRVHPIWRSATRQAPCILRYTYCKAKKAWIDVKKTANSVDRILDRLKPHQEFSNQPAHGSLHG